MSEYGFRCPCNCNGQCGCQNQPPYNPDFPPGGNYWPPPPGPGGPPHHHHPPGPPHHHPPGPPHHHPSGPPFCPGQRPNIPRKTSILSPSKFLPSGVANTSDRLYRTCRRSWNVSIQKATASVNNFSPTSTINSLNPFGKRNKSASAISEVVHHHHHHHHSPKKGNCCNTPAYNWVDSYASAGPPPDAVQGGTDIDGQPIYVGRAYHDGDWIPAKVIPGRRVAYIAYNMQEIPVDRFQVLCGQNAVHWVPDSSGRVPQNAIQAGKTKEGETLFIGRVNHARALTVGKVHPSHRVCYISFDGKEISFPSYEVLVSRY